MPRSSTSLLALLGSVVVASTLAGCHGCDASPHAQAQGADAGVLYYLPVPPSSAATCFLLARRQTRLTDDQIQTLCLGAAIPSGPVQCYLAARRRLNLTDDQKLVLCRCSGSTEPVDCFRRLDFETGLTDGQIQQMCSPTLSLGLLGNCRPLGATY